MPERDAFGRELPSADAAGVPSRPSGADPPAAPGRQVDVASLMGRPMGIVVASVVLACVCLAVFWSQNEQRTRAPNDLDTAMRDFDAAMREYEQAKALRKRNRTLLPGSSPTPAGSRPRTPGASAVPPTGLAAGSLIRRSSFSAAVRSMRRSGVERVATLTVTPASVDASLKTRKGGVRYLQIGPDDALETFPGKGEETVAGSTLSLAAVDTGAPERLARAAAARAGRSVSSVEFLALIAVRDRTRWVIFLEGGRSLEADSRGRKVQDTS